MKLWARALEKSTISNRVQISGTVRAFELVEVLQYKNNVEGAMPLRITMHPVEGADGVPVFGATTAGGFVAPVVPGFRAGFRSPAIITTVPHPVAGWPFYGAIKWGVGGAPTNRILCDWPTGGASIELVADQVEVYAALGDDPYTGVGAERNPVFAAEAGPSQGMGYNDEPLTFNESVDDVDATPAGSIPEFARSVVVAFADTLPATEFYTLFFLGMNPLAAPVFATRLDFADRIPVEIPVPGDAVAWAITKSDPGLPTSLYLQWRIAP